MKFKPLAPQDVRALVLISHTPTHPHTQDLIKGLESEEAKTIAQLLLGGSQDSVRASVGHLDDQHWKEIVEAYEGFKKSSGPGKTEGVRSIEKHRRKRDEPYAC